MDTHFGNRCRSCGSPEVMRVHLTILDDPIAFTACPRCEARRWEREGSALPLDVVLEAVAAR